jgi:hypothetical protein
VKYADISKPLWFSFSTLKLQLYCFLESFFAARHVGCLMLVQQHPEAAVPLRLDKFFPSKFLYCSIDSQVQWLCWLEIQLLPDSHLG